MPFRKFLALLGLTFGSAGCAIHPLPQDVVALDTNGIVYHVRCEAADAVWSAIGKYLIKKGVTDKDRQVGRDMVDGAIPIGQYPLQRLSAENYAKIKVYLPAAIVFDFSLDMSEDNDVVYSSGLVDGLTHAVFSVGARAESDHQRQTIRRFRTSNVFRDLISHDNDCIPDRAPNWNYPIAGNIGLTEMVMTFVDLNRYESLTGADSKDTVPQLADTLVFQTSLTASLTPKLTLTPVKLGPRLSDTTLGGTVFRKDSHKVIVGLSLPPLKKPFNYSGGSFFGALGVPTDAFTRSAAIAVGNKLVDDQIARNIVDYLAVRPYQ